VRLPEESAVELDFFSGEPNPRWTLSASEQTEIEAELSHAEPTAPVEWFAGLGYRGFVVSSAAGRPSAPELRIGHGLIRHRAGETLTYWKDPDRRAERRLLQTARGRLDAGLYACVSAEAGMMEE
jgi:hypothetical protein